MREAPPVTIFGDETFSLYFARHMIYLIWLDQTPGDRANENRGRGTVFHLSTFVISMGDEWFLVTAGHALREIAEAQARGQVLSTWRLMDHGAAHGLPDDGIPCAFDDAPKLPIYDDESGLDYGIIHLRRYYQPLLKAHGVDPFEEATWADPDPDAFDGFWLVGVPEEGLSVAVSDSRLRVKFNHCLLTAEPVDPITADVATKPFPRFYARVRDPEDGKVPHSVSGMSGGPILGYKWIPSGDLAYALVAVQSSWLSDERVIIGCPFKLFVETLRTTLRKEAAVSS